jgi:hypothetical protein
MLGTDAMTAEVLGALDRARIRSIVLRGPVLRRELYGDSSRAYVDADLLVSPADLARTGDVLGDLGFELRFDEAAYPGRVWDAHAQTWWRGENRVDLHWRLTGVEAPADRSWEILAANTTAIDIAGAAARGLSRPGIALIVALHAGHHGRELPKPIADLERALDGLDAATWAEAAQLAGQLDALEAFGAGLRVVPRGEALAAELGLPSVRSPYRRLRAAKPPPASLSVLGILEAPAGRGRARAVLEALFPAPAFMRAAFPVARRGRTGLALAYLTRGLRRAGGLRSAVRAARAVRSSQRS